MTGRPTPAASDPARPPNASSATAPPTAHERLAAWIGRQRWYARAGDATPVVTAVTEIPLPTVPPVVVGIVTLASGERYQLLVPAPPDATARSAEPSSALASSPRPKGPVPDPGPEPDTEPDRGQDPGTLDALARFVGCHATAEPAGDGTTISGHWLGGDATWGDAPTRLLGVEQSNTSAVVAGTHVLKVFRRLQAGPHPELEIGLHLAGPGAVVGPLPVANLTGWYQLTPGREGDEDTVLGVVQELVVGAADGWALVLSALAADPDHLLTRLHGLGGAVARLHGALAQPAPRTDVAPEAPEAFGTVPLGGARLDAAARGIGDAARRILPRLADVPEAVALADRADDVARLADALVVAVGADAGAAIRHHGDLHLGQTVVGSHGWVILDFEGEPTRPLAERRRRHSPLRDVSGLLRSVAYATATHRRSGGRHLAAGWEAAARAAVLDGYLTAIDPALLPTSAVTTSRLLALFELEKVVYELDYELAHRPTWVPLPATGLRALLEEWAP